MLTGSDEDLDDLALYFGLKARGAARAQSGNIFSVLGNKLFLCRLYFNGKSLTAGSSRAFLLIALVAGDRRKEQENGISTGSHESAGIHSRLHDFAFQEGTS